LGKINFTHVDSYSGTRNINYKLFKYKELGEILETMGDEAKEK
jgi:hypothetical protein